MADGEEFPVDDNYGLIDQPEHADVVLEGVVTTGDEGGPVDESTPEPPKVEPVIPVDSWAEVDPDYEELVDEDDEVEDVPDEDIPSGAPDTSDDDATPFQGVGWAFYEIEGRSFDRDGAWQQLAREQFTGALDARIDGLPAGERWEFRVRLIDHNGMESAWSETTLDQLPTDDTPPPAPTAPFVEETSGFITYGTDGTLTGPVPEDLSHFLAYCRQMHPAGDVNGAPGDPRQLARFIGEGYQSTGSLVSEVPHEFWLVAVDTTGNASAWSEIVTATPSEPVDAQTLRDELDAARARQDAAKNELDAAVERVEVLEGDWLAADLPALRQELADAESAVATTQARLDTAEADVAQARADVAGLRDVQSDLSSGLDGAYAQIAAQGGTISAIQQAAIDQAEAAQSEYDRLQGLADAARTRADEVGQEQATTAAEVTQARQEAADAQSAADAAAARAEEARLAAVAAQEAAGSAQETADAAMSSANAKATIYSSTSAPSGTASNGDLWYRWSSTSSDRKLLGIWVREGGAWKSMGTLDATLLPLVDIGAGTFGQLAGDRLTARTVGAETIIASEIAAAVAEFLELTAEQITVGTISADRLNVADLAARIATIVELSADQITTGKLAAARVDITDLFADSAFIAQLRAGLIESIQVTAQKVNAGDIIATGTVDVTHLNVTESMTAAIANFLEVNADMIAVNALDGKTITAPLMQSHADGARGWKHRPDGTSAWYHLSSGELNTEIDMEGKVYAREANIQGRFQTDFGANRVEIDQGDITYYSPIEGSNRTLTNVPHMKFSTPDGAGGTTDPVIAAKPTGGLVLSSGRSSPEFGRAVIEIDGHASALGADFTSHVNTTSVYAAIGITGIGTNSQQLGGIVADGARTRLQGRTPDSHNARDMYVRGVSSSFSLPNSDSVQLINFTYGEPVPTGDRLPFVTCSTQLSNNSNGRMATVGVGNISASGFQGVARNAGGGSPVSYNMLYNALWR